MSDWSVNDIIEFIRLYNVPKHAISFILKHNIDGTTMDESVEFIVKDLQLTRIEDEETILHHWKDISNRNLSPADVIYGKIIDKMNSPVKKDSTCTVPVEQRPVSSENAVNSTNQLNDNNFSNSSQNSHDIDRLHDEHCTDGYVHGCDINQYANPEDNHSQTVQSNSKKSLLIHDNNIQSPHNSNRSVEESILDEAIVIHEHSAVSTTTSSIHTIKQQQQQHSEHYKESKPNTIIQDKTDNELSSSPQYITVHSSNSNKSQDERKMEKELTMQNELLHIQKERIRLQEELIERQRLQLQTLAIASQMNTASSSNHYINSKQTDPYMHTILPTQGTTTLSENHPTTTTNRLHANADTTQLQYDAHWEPPAALLHDSISMLSGSDIYEQASQEERYPTQQYGTGAYTAAEEEEGQVPMSALSRRQNDFTAPPTHYTAADQFQELRECSTEPSRSHPIALADVGIPIWQPPVAATYRAQSAKPRGRDPLPHTGSQTDRRNTVTGAGHMSHRTAPGTAASLPAGQISVHHPEAIPGISFTEQPELHNEASVDSAGMVWYRNSKHASTVRPKTSHTRPTVPMLDLPHVTSPSPVPQTTSSVRENHQNNDHHHTSSRVETSHMAELTEVIQQLAESNAALAQVMRPITAPSAYRQSSVLKKPDVPSVRGKKPFTIQTTTEQHSGNNTHPTPPLHSVQQLFDTARDEAMLQVAQWSRQQQLQHRDLLLAKADKLLALTSRSEPVRGRTITAMEDDSTPWPMHLLRYTPTTAQNTTNTEVLATSPHRPETNHSTRRQKKNTHRTLVQHPTTTNTTTSKVQELITSLAEQYGFTASKPSPPYINSTAIVAGAHHSPGEVSVLTEDNGPYYSSRVGNNSRPGGALLLWNTGSGVIRDGPRYASPVKTTSNPTPPQTARSSSNRSRNAKNVKNGTKAKRIGK